MILRLILGDQLSPEHSWFARCDTEMHYVLMEVRQETDYVLHHAQKIIAIFAAMRSFADQLRKSGHQVHYITIDDPANTHSVTKNLELLAKKYQANLIEYQQPDEWRVDQQLVQFEQISPVRVRCVDSEHFLTDRLTARTMFCGSKRWVMESFYRKLRRQYGVLMQDNEPVGGRWNFDADNRKPWKGEPPAPADSRPQHDHRLLWQTIRDCGVQSFGEPNAEHFRWPIDRQEALAQLNHFVTHTLPYFGDYQDAMHEDNPYLFHSLLSFALNTKMLKPIEVILAAEQAWHRGQAPLHAVEGFIRQILGWREYVRGVYWAQMPQYTESNALEQSTKLPLWFWTGHTKMNCLSVAIGHSLANAYAHHIERLMVIGNFSLLAGINPTAVHQWYLGVYIDAFEWVEAPNTVGMSQFADGGFMATKPYVSSAAYIDRMSNHCKQCQYNKKLRIGDKACPFNALYWDFYLRHQTTLSANPRIGMAYRQLEKMPLPEKQALSDQAQFWRDNLESL